MNHDETPRQELQWMPIPEPIETLRDRFAMAAMSGLCTEKERGPRAAGEAAYAIADAMLNEKRSYEEERIRRAP